MARAARASGRRDANHSGPACGLRARRADGLPAGRVPIRRGNHRIRGRTDIHPMSDRAHSPAHVVAIDIGGSNTKIALVSSEGPRLETLRQLPTPSQGDPEAFLSALVDQVKGLCGRSEPVCGAGIALPGFLSDDLETVIYNPNTPMLVGLSLAEPDGPGTRHAGHAGDRLQRRRPGRVPFRRGPLGQAVARAFARHRRWRRHAGGRRAPALHGRLLRGHRSRLRRRRGALQRWLQRVPGRRWCRWKRSAVR